MLWRSKAVDKEHLHDVGEVEGSLRGFWEQRVQRLSAGRTAERLTQSLGQLLSRGFLPGSRNREGDQDRDVR